MPSFSSSGVQNFQLPAPGNAVLVTLKFGLADNGNPFGFQNLGNQIPNNYTPQGVIIDTRNVTTAETVMVTIGGTTPFEITQAAGVYASYLVPAFDIAIISVLGLQSADTMLVYCTNFPLFPQQYGVPNVTINLSSPPAIGNTTPNTGAFSDLKATTLEVQTSITVPEAINDFEPVQLGQGKTLFDAIGAASTAQTNAEAYASSQAATAQSNAENFATGAANSAQSNAESYTRAYSQPAGTYVYTFNGRSGEVSLSSGDVTGALGYSPMAPNSSGTSATTFSANGGTTYIGAVGGGNGINLDANNYIINGSGIDGIGYNTNGNHNFNSNCYAPNFILTSDRKFKTYIQPVQFAVSALKQLKPKTYMKDGALNSGFIAQDVLEVTPLRHLVHETEAGLHLDYIGMIAWLVRAVQELDRRTA